MLPKEHLDGILASLAALRVNSNEIPLDEVVYEAIRDGKTVRDEYLALLDVLSKHAEPATIEELITSFFESLLELTEHQGPGSWRESEFDAIRFIALELFLSSLALLLVRGHSSAARGIVRETYVSERRGNRAARDYSAFYSQVESIEEQRKRRLQLNRASLVADLLKERADYTGLPFERLQLVDFLLYVRSKLHGGFWYPRTLVYLGHYPEPFDVFLAPNSKRRFRWVEAFLDVQDPQELHERLAKSFGSGTAAQLVLGIWPLDVRRLMNLPVPE